MTGRIHAPFRAGRFRTVRNPSPLSSVMGVVDITAPVVTFRAQAQDSIRQSLELLPSQGFTSPAGGRWGAGCGLRHTYTVPGQGLRGPEELLLQIVLQNQRPRRRSLKWDQCHSCITEKLFSCCTSAPERSANADECLWPSHSTPGDSHALKPASHSCGRGS